MLASLFRLARPKDWIKNIFVVVPVPFALADKQAEAHFDAAAFLLGLAGFCLINSAAYTLNDLCDAEADRLHPHKRSRPIAAGRVSAAAAAVLTAALFFVGLAFCLLAGKSDPLPVLSVVLAYAAISAAYSLGAKHVALLDVFILSSGFVIRVLLGCALLAVQPSPWLLLCTSSLALFLGFAKRRADLVAGLDVNHRPSLAGYSETFLDRAMVISAGVAILTYAIYSIESQMFKPGYEMISMPFVVYGVLDYLRLVDTKNVGGSPVEIAYRSPSLQICAAGWFAAVLWSLK